MTKPIRSKIYEATLTLSRFGLYFAGLCFAVFVCLMVLDYKGIDIVWPLTLSFMWLFGIAFTVGKAHQLSKPDAEFGNGAYIFNIAVGLMWWGILLIATVKYTLSILA